MKKRIISLALVLALAVGICPLAFASEELPRCAITDEAVIIDYVEYKIVNNTIRYEGKTYEIHDSVLVTYDEDGPVYFVLPLEENEVTDPERIAELNASIGKSVSLSRAIPENPVDLPYTASVAKGDYLTVTPAFNVTSFQYSTNLKISGLPINTDPEYPIGKFYIIYSMCDVTGKWHQYQETKNFSKDPTMKIANYSGIRYGMFTITNLYGNPSPAYSYSVYLSTP